MGLESEYATADGESKYRGLIGQLESTIERANRGEYHGPFTKAASEFVNEFDLHRCAQRVLAIPPEDTALWDLEVEHLYKYLFDPTFPPLKKFRDAMLSLLNIPGRVVLYDAEGALKHAQDAVVSAAAENEVRVILKGWRRWRTR